MDGKSMQKVAVMAEGTVRSYDNVVGKGLIARDGAIDVYVNRAAIKDLGPRTLVSGDRVRFRLIDGVKGPVAASVHKVHAADMSGERVSPRRSSGGVVPRWVPHGLPWDGTVSQTGHVADVPGRETFHPRDAMS